MYFQLLEKDLLCGNCSINISCINEQRIFLKVIFRKEKGNNMAPEEVQQSKKSRKEEGWKRRRKKKEED